MRLFRVEMWRTLKDSNLRLCLALFSFCCLLAVGYGCSQVRRQNQIADRLPQWVRESDEAYFETRFKEEEDIGRVHYYLRQPTAHRPRPEAALSLGQRDLHSYHQNVWLRSLYTNLFDAGFENPSRSVAGHFDLAFVLVYLLPLVIIASTHDLLAKETEGRTLPLLWASGSFLSTLFLFKLGTRCLLTSGLLTAIVTASLLWVGASVAVLPAWLAVVLGYNLFWFGLAALVVSLAWKAARSAGLLLAVWTLLTIVSPAFLNLLLPRQATQSGAALTIRCRQVVNHGWDSEKALARLEAQKRFAGYADAPLEGEKFSWSWYYAMHDAGDQAVEAQAHEYFESLRAKDERAFAYSLVAPPVRAQLLLDRLAATDLGAHLGYYQHVIEARKAMQKVSLPRVFSEEKLTKDELFRLHDQLPAVEFRPPAGGPSDRGIAELWWVALALVGLAWMRLGGLEQSLKRGDA